jgi:hypothetical protein
MQCCSPCVKTMSFGPAVLKRVVQASLSAGTSPLGPGACARCVPLLSACEWHAFETDLALLSVLWLCALRGGQQRREGRCSLVCTKVLAAQTRVIALCLHEGMVHALFKPLFFSAASLSGRSHSSCSNCAFYHNHQHLSQWHDFAHGSCSCRLQPTTGASLRAAGALRICSSRAD